jgi:hypothetical protein
MFTSISLASIFYSFAFTFFLFFKNSINKRCQLVWCAGFKEICIHLKKDINNFYDKTENNKYLKYLKDLSEVKTDTPFDIPIY